MLQGKETEQLTLFSDHNESLLRRQPRAMTIGHSPKGVAARPVFCLCSEGYLRQACGCLVDPDDVQQQAVSVLGSLDVQPHLCWCSGFLHSPGWHAALQQCLEPIPILQTKSFSSPAVWHVLTVELSARAACCISSALNHSHPARQMRVFCLACSHGWAVGQVAWPRPAEGPSAVPWTHCHPTNKRQMKSCCVAQYHCWAVGLGAWPRLGFCPSALP